MRVLASLRLAAVALLAAVPALAAAQEVVPAPPPAPVEVTPSEATGLPVPAAPAAPAGETVSASPRFALGSWLLHAHLDVGAEPHPRFTCAEAGSASCAMISFGVGGQLLWRGTLGLGVGLYLAQGSPIVPGAADEQALGDRLSVPLSLAVRPLGWRVLSKGDSWVNRLAAGLSIELGPSLEYVRSSSATLPAPCTIPAVAYKAGLHGGASLDVPLLGDTHGGWLALRLGGRVLVGGDTDLAPTQGSADPVCKPQVHMPGVAAQLFAGLSYYL